MRQTVRKFGLLMMLAAALTVAGHIFQHCTAYSAETFNDCRICQAIMAVSAHAMQPAEVELVLLHYAVIPITPEYYFSPASSDQSRAPPPVFFA